MNKPDFPFSAYEISRRYIILRFLSSPFAGKRDIGITILVRCMYVRPCVRPNLFGP